MTAADQPPRSQWIKGLDDPDCPVHPKLIQPLRHGQWYRVTDASRRPQIDGPWLERGEPTDRRITFRPTRRHWWRFWRKA